MRLNEGWNILLTVVLATEILRNDHKFLNSKIYNGRFSVEPFFTKLNPL